MNLRQVWMLRVEVEGMVLELRFPTSRVKERTPFPEHHLLVWPEDLL